MSAHSRSRPRSLFKYRESLKPHRLRLDELCVQNLAAVLSRVQERLSSTLKQHHLCEPEVRSESAVFWPSNVVFVDAQNARVRVRVAD